MNLIVIAGLLAGATVLPPDSVVLRDRTHTNGLIFEREVKDGTIVVTETWSSPFTSRIIKSIYSDAGAPTERDISTTERRTVPGRTNRVDATIKPGGALVTIVGSAGPGKPANIPLRQQASITDPSVRWFTTDKPEKGATASFMNFDPEFRYWEEVKVTFEGRGKLGSSPEGNLVTRKTARKTIHLLLDDKGLPIVWEENQLRLAQESH